jgi:hypothetical protein
MSSNRRSLVALAVLSILVPAGAAAQSGSQKGKPLELTSRNLSGVVRLPNNSVAEGAVVKIKNLKTLQIRSFITQADGKYSFFALSANADYEVVAESQGMASKSRTLSLFDSRPEVTMDFTLENAKK